MSTINDFQVPCPIMRDPAPWISGGPGGREGEMTFLVGINDLPSFLETLAGTTETIDLGGGTTIERVVPLVHPDVPEMMVVGYYAEAFGRPGGTGASAHTGQFSHYRVRCNFATLPFLANGDTAYYTWTTDAGENHETIPGSTLQFSDGTSVTGDAGLPMPVVVLNLTTFMSVTPVTFALASLIGKVSSAAVDDYPAGTLRFTNVRSDYNQGMFSRSLVKSYQLKFREKPWNEVLRLDGVWESPTLGTSGLTKYQSSDLNILKYM